MKLTTENLVVSGYKKYDDDSWCDEACIAMWEKKFFSLSGEKMFFVHIYEWDMGVVTRGDQDYEQPHRFELNSQFQNATGTFNVELLHAPDRTIEQVEQFAKDVFNQMECIPAAEQ